MGLPGAGHGFHHPESLTALVPRLFVDAFGALPLRVAAGKILYLGFEDRLDPVLALAVERMTGLQVESGLVRESDFRPAMRACSKRGFRRGTGRSGDRTGAGCCVGQGGRARAARWKSRLVRVHDCLWLRMWLSPQSGPLPDRARSET